MQGSAKIANLYGANTHSNSSFPGSFPIQLIVSRRESLFPLGKISDGGSTPTLAEIYWYSVFGLSVIARDQSRSLEARNCVGRPSLLQVLLLVDATVPTQQIDLDCAQWLYENGIPYSVIYTKLDKRKKKCLPPLENIAKFEVSPLTSSWTCAVICAGKLASAYTLFPFNEGTHLSVCESPLSAQKYCELRLRFQGSPFKGHTNFGICHPTWENTYWLSSVTCDCFALHSMELTHRMACQTGFHWLQECMREFMPVLPGSVATSASEKQGKDELLMYLAALRLHVGYNAWGSFSRQHKFAIVRLSFLRMRLWSINFGLKWWFWVPDSNIPREIRSLRWYEDRTPSLENPYRLPISVRNTSAMYNNDRRNRRKVKILGIQKSMSRKHVTSDSRLSDGQATAAYGLSTCISDCALIWE